MLWSTGLTSLTIWENTSLGLRPWVSWEHVHSKWNRADAYVWVLMSPWTRRLTLLFWSAIPVSAVTSFIFLGFGEDAVREYSRIGEAVISTFRSRLLPKRDKKFGKGIPPVLQLPLSGLRLVLFGMR